MNAITPSSASETTWKATSRRLCRLTMRGVRSSRMASSMSRCHLVAEPRAAEPLGVPADGAGVEPAIAARRAIAVGERLGVGSSTRTPVSPATTVSSAPPRPSATTGRPHACASSGTMPKSSSPGSSDDRRAPVQLADLVVRDAAEELHVGAGGALERGALRPVADNLQRHAGAARHASIARSMRL